MRFGYWVASQMVKRRWLPALLLEREELESVCLFALVRAAGLFDPKRGVTFRTYGMHVLRTEVARAALHSQVVRFPQTKFDRRQMTPGISVVTMTDLSDTVDMASIGGTTGEQQADNNDESDYLRAAIDTLKPQARQVMELIYYQKHSLRQIGRIMGLSHEWVRQIRDESLSILRKFTVPNLNANKKKGDIACHKDQPAIVRRKPTYLTDGSTAPREDTTTPGDGCDK